MNKNINLIAFGTFGNPNGFRQTFFIGRKELADVVKTFDLNTNAIKLVPNSKMYSIRKENLNGVNSISYSKYTFAKEQNSERGGTFVGSSLLFTNEIANELLTINLLDDFHENLISKNIQNNVIKVNHSDKFSVSKPKDFDKIPFNLNSIEEVNFSQFSNKALVVYSEIKIDSLIPNLQKSLELFNIYDTIYFTDNNEIAEFVYHKGLFKLVKSDGFEQEIISIQNERQNRINKSKSEFEQEKQKLENDKINVVSELNNQISINEKNHLENERLLKESKNNIETIKSFYTEFSRKLDDYINQLNSGRKLEQVRELYNENKRIFITSISELKQPNYVKNIPKVKASSNLQIPIKTYPQSAFGQNINNSNPDYKRRHRKINYYKISTLIISILWISTLIYFIWVKDDRIVYVESTTTAQEVTELKKEETKKTPEQEQGNLVELNPIPNSKLTDSDLRRVLKEGIKGKSVNQIVEIIFKKNPTDIESKYKNQKEAYEQLLISKNKSCFENNISISDSLTIIPSFLVK